MNTARILPLQIDRPDLHPDWIDDHAFGIVKALQKSGFTTYLVGGCVRDLLLGVHPKDFDIATSAHPNQVKRLIHMAFVIGKRFRLVLVKRGDQQFEVATFRKDPEPTVGDEGLQPEESPEEATELQTIKVDDNVFGTPEEDAKRRDFTINALFYDPVADSLIDYVEGAKDIEARLLRMIGDPDIRLREDPIRIFRALRLSHKLNLKIEDSLRASIAKSAPLLNASVLPRRREEFLKLMKLKEPSRALFEAYDLGVLHIAFPFIEQIYSAPEGAITFELHLEALRPLVEDWNSALQIFFWSVSAASLTLRDLGHSASPEELHLAMRDQLGMHKHEITTTFEAYRIHSLLAKSEDLKKKGDRRRNALVSRDGFDLAIGLAQHGSFLGAENVAFWRELRAQMQDTVELKKTKLRLARTKRNRRKSGRRGPHKES